MSVVCSVRPALSALGRTDQELPRYALAFGMLCMLCLFFDFVPLLASIGGRSEIDVQPMKRSSPRKGGAVGQSALLLVSRGAGGIARWLGLGSTCPLFLTYVAHISSMPPCRPLRLGGACRPAVSPWRRAGCLSMRAQTHRVSEWSCIVCCHHGLHEAVPVSRLRRPSVSVGDRSVVVDSGPWYSLHLVLGALPRGHWPSGARRPHGVMVLDVGLHRSARVIASCRHGARRPHPWPQAASPFVQSTACAFWHKVHVLLYGSNICLPPRLHLFCGVVVQAPSERNEYLCLPLRSDRLANATASAA